MFRLSFPSLKSITILVLIFLLFTTSTIAQSELVNDWEKELSKAKGQDRIDLIVRLLKDLPNENIPKAESLAMEGITLAKEKGDSLSIYRIGANLGSIFLKLKKTDKGIEWTQKSLDYFGKNKKLVFDKAKHQLTLASLLIQKGEYVQADSLIWDSESYFKMTNDLYWQSIIPTIKGIIYFTKKEYDKSLIYYSESLKLSQNIGDIEDINWAKRNVGVIKRVQGKYPESLDLLFQVVSSDCSSRLKSLSYNDIGVVYEKLKDWEPAIENHNKAIEMKKRVGLEASLTYSLYNIGTIHMNQLNFGEALNYYKQSLKISKKYKLESKIAETLGAIGNIYGETGEFKKADIYYDQQLEIAIARNDWEGKWYVNYNKGYFLHKAEKYDEALKYLLKSHQLAEENGRLPLLLQSSAMMANVHESLGQIELSNQYGEQYYRIQDSINSFKKMKKIGVLEQKHLSQIQKDSLNSETQNDTYSNESNESSNKIKIAIGFGLSILILTWLSWLYKNNRKKVMTFDKNKPLDSAKIDQYFEELFTLLKQNRVSTEEDSTPSHPSNVTPINDMAKFLKDKLVTPNDWESFEHYFEKIHKDFFKNLKSTYPTITTNELNMCALLKT